MSNSDLNNSVTAPRKNSKNLYDSGSFGSGQFPNTKINNGQGNKQINISSLYESKPIDNKGLTSTKEQSWLKVINIKNSMVEEKQVSQVSQFKQNSQKFMKMNNNDDQYVDFPSFLPKKSQQQIENSFFLNFKKHQSNKSFGLYNQQSKSFNIEKSKQFNLYDNQKKQQQQIVISSKTQQYYYKNILKQLYNKQYLNYISNNRISRLQKKNFVRDTYNGQSTSFNIIREPIIFKNKSEGFRPNKLSGNYVCKLINNIIYYKNVLIQKQSQINENQQIACNFIQINHNQYISPSVQIDSEDQRLFYYSNTRQQIVILSLSQNKKNEPQICRVKTRTQRLNPILYLISIANKKILLIVGGYTKINNSKQVEGSKQIQLFEIDSSRKTISKSRIIKLLNGRIYPLIVSPTKIEQRQSILLIGGNTIGTLIQKQNIQQTQISFSDPKIVKINRSSNVQGVYITTKQILQCINYENDINLLPQMNNITVQVDDKVQLVSGYVDYIKTRQYSNKFRILIFLPKQQLFYTMKVIKKQIKISKYTSKSLIQYNKGLFEPKLSYQLLQMKNIKNIGLQYYQINQKKYCKKKSIGSQKVNKCLANNIGCNICQFM